MIELELAQFAEETGRAKLTRENAKDWCNVCRVFIETLGKINPELHRGALTNMFHTMVDRDGIIETGIDAYSELVMTEEGRLSEDAYKQLLAGCNDDGTRLKDIGNAIVEAWSSLAVAKGCLEESDVTDAGESLLSLMNGGQERWKKHHGCLAPIVKEMEHDFERHVKKFGPINKGTLLHMLFFRIVFAIGGVEYTLSSIPPWYPWKSIPPWYP